MSDLTQITFDFSEEGVPLREPLSGKPIVAAEKKAKPTRGRRNLKDTPDDNINIPEDEILFKKQYYTIGEVAEMFGVNISLLRHWEGEFGMDLKKNGKGDRFFRPAEIKLLSLIHDLLRRRMFTIEGAKEYIRQNKQLTDKYEMIQSLQRLKVFLLQLKAHL